MIQVFEGDGVDHGLTYVLGIFAQILSETAHDGTFEYVPYNRENRDIEHMSRYVGFPKDRVLIRIVPHA